MSVETLLPKNLSNIRKLPITFILAGRSVIENGIKDHPDNAFNVLFKELAINELKDLPESCLSKFEILFTFFRYSIDHPKFMRVTKKEIKPKDVNKEEENMKYLLCLTALGASVCYPEHTYEEYSRSYNRQFKTLMFRENKGEPIHDDLITAIGTGRVNLLPFGRGNEFDLTPERFWAIVPFYYNANIDDPSLNVKERQKNLNDLLDLGYLVLDGIRDSKERRGFRIQIKDLEKKIKKNLR